MIILAAMNWLDVVGLTAFGLSLLMELGLVILLGRG
jgi:hypothetical protein